MASGTGEGQSANVPSAVSVEALKGMLRKPAKPVSIQAMNRAIARQGAKAR